MLIFVNEVRTRLLLTHEQHFALYFQTEKITKVDYLYLLRNTGAIPAIGLDYEGYKMLSADGAEIKAITKEVMYVKFFVPMKYERVY